MYQGIIKAFYVGWTGKGQWPPILGPKFVTKAKLKHSGKKTSTEKRLLAQSRQELNCVRVLKAFSFSYFMMFKSPMITHIES